MTPSRREQRAIADLSDKTVKRATTVSLVAMGTGLLALYSFTGARTCTEPDPAHPQYAQLKQEYDACRSRRSSSSSSRSTRWFSSSGSRSSAVSTSTASRSGFGSFGSRSGS